MEGAKSLDDFRPLFEPETEHPYLLDKVKQISLYTDCLGNAHWSEPSNAIDKRLATMLIQIASLLIPKTEVSEEEVNLWVKHMSSAKGKTYSEHKKALLHWYAEIQELGLTSIKHDVTELLDWLGFKIDGR
jgi:hypothetical protein